MDMILSAPITPKSIVSGGKQLSVPIYQRLFVWGEVQIDTLLNDLWNARNTNADYHLGVITVHENERQQWEIVDGQQRLTFLTLLGCVLAKKQIANWLDFVHLNDGGLRLSFHGRSEDAKDVADYLAGKQSTFRNRAFARFVERFERFASGKNEEDLRVYAAYCFDHAAFLANELPAVYGPEELNLYFEKMNSTGRQLTPLEIVKGKWFSPYAAQWNSCMNFDSALPDNMSHDGNTAGEKKEVTGLYLADVLAGSETYKAFRERFGIGEKGQNAGNEATGERSSELQSRLVMRDEILALHVLRIMQNWKDIRSDIEIPLDRRKLIENFGKAGFPDAEKSKVFISRLEEYRKWIDKNIIYLKADAGQYSYAFRTDKSDAEITDQDEDKKEQKRMRQFQSMLYVSSGEGQEWVFDMYLQLNGAALTFDALRKAESTATWHPNGPITIESMRYHVIARYWFWKLDYLLWELHENNRSHYLFAGLAPDDHEAISQYRFRQNRSIEHLHPQSKEGGEWGTRKQSDSAMHRFGNLAMMSVEGNSAQSNDGIGTKFGRVKDWLSAKRLESIKMLLMFHRADKKAEGWSPEMAEQHEKAMISLLEEDRKKWGG